MFIEMPYILLHFMVGVRVLTFISPKNQWLSIEGMWGAGDVGEERMLFKAFSGKKSAYFFFCPSTIN